jgi:hypothetical protein
LARSGRGNDAVFGTNPGFYRVDAKAFASWYHFWRSAQVESQGTPYVNDDFLQTHGFNRDRCEPLAEVVASWSYGNTGLLPNYFGNLDAAPAIGACLVHMVVCDHADRHGHVHGGFEVPAIKINMKNNHG